MRLGDILSLSFRSIRGNTLRTGITVAIIAFGIMALIGIVTAVEAMEQKFTESFSSMGANGFQIRYRESTRGFSNNTEVVRTQRTRRAKRSNEGKMITVDQAETFKREYKFPATVGISISGGNNAIVTGEGKKTNPTVRVSGGDENFIDLNGYKVAHGRGLNETDIKSATNVCIIGSDVAARIFGRADSRGLDREIRVNNIPFRVIGILESKGSTFGFSRDNLVILSYTSVRRFFAGNRSFNIGVKVAALSMMDDAIGEAEGTMRRIRQLVASEGDNFYIDKSDSFAQMAIDNTKNLTIAAIAIGLITLIGAAIGLMNIMLVSVTERTKEVGLIKAIGGRQNAVAQQFLYEAVLISLFGAFFGIILGVFVGNLFSMLLGTGFVIPWLWVLLGIVICTIVGILAGLYPAMKASKLNPIEALRYE